MPITDGMITILEDFISSGEESRQPAMSRQNLKYGKKIYNEMLTKSGPDYQIIGSEASGYTCYGIYKSKEEKIYIVTARTTLIDVQRTTISSCILINNESWFGSD